MSPNQTWFTTSEAARYLNLNLASFKSIMTRYGVEAKRTSKKGDLRWHRSQVDAYRIYNSSKPTLRQKFKLMLLDWVFSD